MFCYFSSTHAQQDFYFEEDKGFYCLKKTGCTKKGHLDTKDRVDDSVKRRLAEFLEPYNRALFRLLGRDFDWDEIE